MEERWCCSGHWAPKDNIVFLFQVFLVYIIVFTSIVCIALNVGEQNIWIILMSCSIGYILPSPSLKDERILLESAKQHIQGTRSIP
jgi:hypothetical protein